MPAGKSATKPTMVMASSSIGVTELLKKASELSQAHVIQLFDPDSVCCPEHLSWAYLNAKTLFSNKENRAKAPAVEMLLCASLSSQISDSINRMGAKSSKRFILFSDSTSSYRQMSKYLRNVSEFKISKKEAEARIRRLGIVSGQVEDLAQEIAFHAMER
jgi:tRNA threonylcarbamoyladenosine modification (KEOPS) complex Cgi121 subunit